MTRFKLGETLSLWAPAKINLSLYVGPRRDDGYHELASWMHAITLADNIDLTPSATPKITLDVSLLPGLSAAQSFSLSILQAGDREDNLVVRAIRAYIALNPFADIPGWQLRLQKAVPFQAGLGGGSADAAAVLRAFNTRHPSPLSPEAMIALARSLGADVPFGLSEGSVWAEGVGERMQPRSPLPAWSVWLIKPRGTAISTPDAFKRLAEFRLTAPLRHWPVAPPNEANELDDEGLSRLLHNDFQEPMAAACPELGALMSSLQQVLAAYPVRPALSGSGPTVFVIFPERPSQTFRDELFARFPAETYWQAWSQLSPLPLR